MKQRLDSHPVLITPDYNETLILAIELSNSKWVLAAQVPGLANVKNKRTIEPTVEALMAAIDGYRARAAKTGRKVQRIIATYEAGWSGFWLARWLMRQAIETHVIQPSSVPVDRRARRAKSDGIDAELLLRTLLAWLRAEPRVCSMVPIPDEADEDARRLVRERSELIKERIKLVNRIGAVLATLGVAALAGRVPALQRHQTVRGERQFRIAHDPVALHHGPAGRRRRLLILSGKRVAADLELHRVQYVERLALGRQRFARFAAIGSLRREGDRLVAVGNRWKAENIPFVGLGQEKAGQVVDVDALHHDHDRARALVVKAGEQRIREPLIGCQPLCFRQGVVRLQRIVDDDDVAASTGQRAADPAI